MFGKIKELSEFRVDDVEKIGLINELLFDKNEKFCLKEYYKSYKSPIEKSEDIVLSAPILGDTKFCPKCGKTFPDGENVCMDCLVHLKNISDKIDVFDIEFDPQFSVVGDNDYGCLDDLLSGENISKINAFDFNHDDYSNVLHDIKAEAFRNFDKLVKDNEIDFDGLDILDKVILFAKSFVKLDYKSSGHQLGYFENNTVFIDDRQSKSLQITTLIHELSHFLIQEILIRIVCKLLNATKNEHVVSLVVYILSFAPFTQLIDEYSAHNVEGRFTLFGYQDYSSFKQIEAELDGEMPPEEIEVTKSIGNNFSISIKEILEAFIDRDLREDIKDQFLKDNRDRPNYRALEMENLKILNDDGFMRAIWLILNDGCEIATLNVDKLK